jgi:hypothetical protein
MNKKYDYTISERSRRFRSRKKLKREAAQKIADEQAAVASRLAEEQYQAELAAERASLGLAPRKTGKQRTAEWRARKAAKLAAEQAERDRPTPIEQIVNLVL